MDDTDSATGHAGGADLGTAPVISPGVQESETPAREVPAVPRTYASDSFDPEFFGGIQFDTTADIAIPPSLIDQVIGQEHAVEVIKKAATQRRHVMMIGSPGTGKSMLAKAMSELLPKEEMQDILTYPNPEDNNNPIIRVVPAGRGKEIVAAHRAEARKRASSRNTLLMVILLGVIVFSIFSGQLIMGLLVVIMVLFLFKSMMPRDEAMVPKLIVSNKPDSKAPFVDGTGSHAGALLGDVRHDPFQSGGLETPAHDRVEAGAIHRAHKGVLFIDEINTLELSSQQSLLTALQEGEFPITGQSDRSSGAMVRTEPVPCRFIMIAAGNLDAMQGMHPALRSRIRGYGYEVYMSETMDDTPTNRARLVRFVAQEVQNDGKIPHFDPSAVSEILREARRRSGRKGHLTLKLRDLGGLVRVAGDLARQAGDPATTMKHVVDAKQIARSVEDQISDEYIRRTRDYDLTIVSGTLVGRVNGLAVVGNDAGSVLPITAEVTPSQGAGAVIATGLLKEIAQESIKNVSALIKKFSGTDIRKVDIHVQFIGTYNGVEGDSASVTVATAVISALEDIPVRQDVAMTGSLSVRGDVLPIGGVTYKIEAAAKAGIHTIIIPQSNLDDVLIEERYKEMVTIIPVTRIEEVLEYALVPQDKEAFEKKLGLIGKHMEIPKMPEATEKAEA
ncbi:MAG: ATP-dependent protease LonB [Methanocorpusculum sp.]|uniref:Archaeal Lon protease n=1 Tax=Methanocorpusculum petauri TaxID=3002863 RepID=A0ABT4IHM9_9EURY|nr:ATP-dependent protease LonB [Methanocorpusculum petauri]MDE2443333.1 ATP-dependent protease LonB [Methanocorpusculum sp.]MCZ0860598.1 ATP-dependent protease LonB [Methanocorpusculum petauri]MDE2519538.1 ATP-dependent protease LonB [Methanocorpusculum sp.]MDE2521774.1 ATP-dependent protease LonB [Methanocorpusculum sp.]MDE2523991.1 ATP-dependent protease LonB [Methanocorpusculum sp.]